MGGSPRSNPRALACLVLRDSELAYLLRSLINLSPPPPPAWDSGGTKRLVHFCRHQAPEKN